MAHFMRSVLARVGTVAARMETKKLKEAATCLRQGIGETTTYLLDDYPQEHRRRIRTNNMIERLSREIRRRTGVVGAFPDGKSALTPVSAKIRYVTANDWSPPLPGHVPTPGHRERSEPDTATTTGHNQSAQTTGHYRLLLGCSYFLKCSDFLTPAIVYCHISISVAVVFP
jgi:hypothetical protein